MHLITEFQTHETKTDGRKEEINKYTIVVRDLKMPFSTTDRIGKKSGRI